MPEQQNIEYKQSWLGRLFEMGLRRAPTRYARTIYIGKDDDGKTVGVADYKKLMDDLPNKIRDVLSHYGGSQFARRRRFVFHRNRRASLFRADFSLAAIIITESGSTKQELNGSALMEFLLRKSGRTWDDVIEGEQRPKEFS